MNEKRMSRKESQDRTRKRLCNAACREFSRNGIAGSSIERITRSAGFTAGAFYSNFRNKQELALEILSHSSLLEVDSWLDIVHRSDEFGSAIQLLREQFNAFVADRDRCLLNAELRLEGERDPAFGQKYNKVSIDVLERVKVIVRDLHALSGSARTIDIDRIAATIQALALGLATERSGAGALATKDAGALLTQCLADLMGIRISEAGIALADTR